MRLAINPEDAPQLFATLSKLPSGQRRASRLIGLALIGLTTEVLTGGAPPIFTHNPDQPITPLKSTTSAPAWTPDSADVANLFGMSTTGAING
jgi:hypothetical protein